MSSFLSATCVNMCEIQETVSHYSSLNKTCCVSVWMSSCGQQFLSSVGLPHSSTDATTTQMQDKNSSDSICELSYLKEKKKNGGQKPSSSIKWCHLYMWRTGRVCKDKLSTQSQKWLEHHGMCQLMNKTETTCRKTKLLHL